MYHDNFKDEVIRTCSACVTSAGSLLVAAGAVEEETIDGCKDDDTHEYLHGKRTVVKTLGLRFWFGCIGSG